MPVIPKRGGPYSLYCTDCGVWTPNTANAEMKKEGFFAHSHVCGHMQKDEIRDEDYRKKQKQEHEEKEIVYCKDCAHLGFKDFYGICEDGPMTGIVQPWDFCSKGVRKKPKEEKRDRGMTYLGAIEICNKIEEHSEEEALQAIEKILGMETINAVSKDALLNVVRWFWKRCVTTTEEAEATDDTLG